MRSVNDVIQDIGGNTAAASLLGVTIAAVSNWKFDGRIPPRHFRSISRELKYLGKAEAPDALFFTVYARRKSTTRAIKHPKSEPAAV